MSVKHSIKWGAIISGCAGATVILVFLAKAVLVAAEVNRSPERLTRLEMWEEQHKASEAATQAQIEGIKASLVIVNNQQKDILRNLNDQRQLLIAIKNYSEKLAEQQNSVKKY